MRTNRIQYVRTVGLMVTVGLLLALAVQVGLTAAATDTSGATSSMALRGAVGIHLWGPGLGPQQSGGSRELHASLARSLIAGGS